MKYETSKHGEMQASKRAWKSLILPFSPSNYSQPLGGGTVLVIVIFLARLALAS